MYRKIPVLGVIFLLVLSTVCSIAISFDSVKTQDTKLDMMLDNLRYLCTTLNGFNSVKYEYYKEQLLSQYLYESSNNEVVEQVRNELATSIEQPSFSITSVGGPMDSPWPMKCHDVRHTGQSPYSTADNPCIEKWRFLSDWVEGGIAIDNNGVIYFGDAARFIYAVYPDGTLKWKYQTDGWIWCTPAIAEDGTIYIGTWGSGLYAINPDGTKKWRVGTSGDISSSPAIGDDGTIYFGDLGDFGENSKIWAVNPNGTKKWHYILNDRIYSDPCIGDDGTIYIGSNDNYLYAMNPDGTLKWRFKTGKAVGGSPSIADDGTIYAYGSWDFLYALYPNNGTVKWKCDITVNSNPSICSEGTIYIGGTEKLWAVYPNGTKKWTFDLGNERWIAGSAPAISADGTIYIGTNIGSGVEGGEIIVINPNGTERWRKKIANEWVDSSPSIGEDGTVYIGSTCEWGGYIHAFGNVESNSPPYTPSISGETNGEPGKRYWYTLRSYDPDNNPVSFYIEWGDGTTTGWSWEHASDELTYFEKTYSKSGKYTIRAKARDTLGEESDWGYLEVTMPRNKAINNPILNYLQFHFNLFPLLKKIFNFQIISKHI